MFIEFNEVFVELVIIFDIYLFVCGKIIDVGIGYRKDFSVREVGRF